MKFEEITNVFKTDVVQHDIKNYDETLFVMACGYRREQDEMVTGVTIDKDAMNNVYCENEDEKLQPIDIGNIVTKLMVREAVLKFKEYASEDNFKINPELNVTDLTNKILHVIEDGVLVEKSGE